MRTAAESLKKYGFLTDPESTLQRLDKNDYYKIVVTQLRPAVLGVSSSRRLAVMLRDLDVINLRAHLNQGQRYKTAVHTVRARLAASYAAMPETELQKSVASIVDATFEDIINEAEGEKKE